MLVVAAAPWAVLLRCLVRCGGPQCLAAASKRTTAPAAPVPAKCRGSISMATHNSWSLATCSTVLCLPNLHRHPTLIATTPVLDASQAGGGTPAHTCAFHWQAQTCSKCHYTQTCWWVVAETCNEPRRAGCLMFVLALMPSLHQRNHRLSNRQTVRLTDTYKTDLI